MPLDDKVEKMNGGVYGVLKVLLGKAGNNIAGAVNYRRIETYWGNGHESVETCLSVVRCVWKAVGDIPFFLIQTLKLYHRRLLHFSDLFLLTGKYC